MKATVRMVRAYAVITAFLGIGLVAAVLALPLGTAVANPIPVPGNVDHYETYWVLDAPGYPFVVGLTDQFGAGTFTLGGLKQLGTPVSKNGEPILDPRTHLTWWTLFGQEVGRRVIVSNQFGDQELEVTNAHYLLAPAVKNEPGPPPTSLNHFKCYDATGPALNLPVHLENQFEIRDVTVLRPEIFCNPVEKRLPTGEVFPIVDPNVHLVCYRIEPVEPLTLGVHAVDQFGEWDLPLDSAVYLCVPSLKTGVVPTGPTTWSRVRALYR